MAPSAAKVLKLVSVTAIRGAGVALSCADSDGDGVISKNAPPTKAVTSPRPTSATTSMICRPLRLGGACNSAIRDAAADTTSARAFRRPTASGIISAVQCGHSTITSPKLVRGGSENRPPQWPHVPRRGWVCSRVSRRCLWLSRRLTDASTAGASTAGASTADGTSDLGRGGGEISGLLTSLRSSTGAKISSHLWQAILTR